MQGAQPGRCLRADASYPAAALDCAPPVRRRARQSRRKQGRLLVQAVVAPPKQPVGTELPAFEAWSTGAPVKKRTDLKTIMLLGAGPIVIGQVRQWGDQARANIGFLQDLTPACGMQACEFDYSGTQACKALR